MCKYCETKPTGALDERCNGNITLDCISDGSQIYLININTYEMKSQNNRDAELILEHAVEFNDGDILTVNEKHIKINYCPFCGEKL